MGHTWLEALHPQVACIFNALSLALTANTESVSNKVLSTHTLPHTHTYTHTPTHICPEYRTLNSFNSNIFIYLSHYSARSFLFSFLVFFLFFWRLMTSCFCSNAHSFRLSLHMCVGDVCVCEWECVCVRV